MNGDAWDEDAIALAQAAAATWPNTSEQEPPVDHPYASAVWLLGRHPQLAQLAARFGVVDQDEDGLWLDQYRLSDLINLYDLGRYGPNVDEFGRMSRTEQVRLRLLAMFGVHAGVAFNTTMLTGFDAEGQRLIADWCRAVAAG
ncbi:MAG TPA: hypothetical protein VGH11_13460 [Jatrophihabitans sp.]|jgi:hypothetical protein